MFEDTVEHRLRPIAAAFAKSDLVRIRVADERTEIELRRAPSAVTADTASGAGADPGQGQGAYDLIAAEVVGIVRFAPAGLQEGGRVESDQELAYVEALGLRNPVRAVAAGRLACIYVGDGEPVDYGQPLFAIDRS